MRGSAAQAISTPMIPSPTESQNHQANRQFLLGATRV
jgi:hypothetical protein